MPQSKPQSRRQFAKTLALTAVTPLAISPAALLAQEPKTPVPTRVSAEALMQIVHARFSKFLNEKQMADVAKSVLRHQFIADALKRVPLKNSDEPAFAFRADF
jgi:hypothetical protein